MSTNSLQELLEKLKSFPVTLGWGAVFAFSRERVNRMLEQQFTAAFTADRFIAPCSGVVGSGLATLTSIVFGAPVLSFEIASVDKAAAKLTIPLLAGTYQEAQTSEGRPLSRVSGRALRLDSGATLTLDIDLHGVGSDSDHTGRITIDLGDASNPRCNLSDDPSMQEAIGRFLLDYLHEQPKHQTTYVLGLVDAGNYAPLNPVRFAIRTQAAPGAKMPGARNAGDGAVLVFMKLQGYDDDETDLPDADYPYLIPDDSSGGVPLYTASLFVSRWLSHFVNDTNLDVLKNSMLPAGYAFVEATGGRYTPNDTAIFGNLTATRTNILIEPAIADLESMNALDFKALRGDGSVVSGVKWASGCLNNPVLKGEISQEGRFSATNYPFRAPPVLMTTVTATYTENGQDTQATALVLVRVFPLAVDSRVSSSSPGGSAITLTALGQSATPDLEWALLDPKLGSVEADDQVSKATYTPPPTGGVPLVAQRMQILNVASQDSAAAVVMLESAGTETFAVEPPFVGNVLGESEIAFEVPEQAVRELLRNAGDQAEDDVFWRWSVVGEGTVVGDGRTAQFSPPRQRASHSSMSVLVCELIGPEVGHVHGYAVVQLTPMSAEEAPNWEGIDAFDLTTPDGEQAFANGMQQVRVRIKIETSPVTIDGVDHYIPISPVEEASIRLVRHSDNTDVPFVDPTQDGIERDDPRQWMASIRRNRFNFFNPAAREEPAPANYDGVTYIDLYVHMKTDETQEFYAVFESHKGETISSRVHGDDVFDTVSIKCVPPPAVGLEDYTFERDRIWYEGGQPDENDDFSYIPRSLDFWTLAYRRSGFDPAGFATLRIERNSSSIQWESELLDETYFSYLSWIFSPKHRQSPPAPKELSHDPYLAALFHEVGHAPPSTDLHQTPPQPGELVVALRRLDDMTYWYDGQAHDNKAKLFRRRLDPPVLYKMLDENGNRHDLQIGFQNPSMDGSRNTLLLILQ